MNKYHSALSSCFYVSPIGNHVTGSVLENAEELKKNHSLTAVTVRNPNALDVNLIKLGDVIFGYGCDALLLPNGAVITQPSDDDWKELFMAIPKIGWSFDSHYKYLEFCIDTFGELVFNKPNSFHFNGGFIGAHGDKCYGYMLDSMVNHGIHPHRFAMLYLLTYSAVMDRPKHESEQWVVDNYDKYLPLLIKAEEQAGISEFYTAK